MLAVRFATTSGDVRLGRLDGDQITDAGAAPAIGFDSTPEAWGIVAAAAGTTYAVDSVDLLHPVHPGKLIAIGLNYRDHAEESELDIPEVPVVFAKFPSSLIGSGQTIVVPREETRPDYEAELAIVIGKRTFRATLENALDSVGGYTAINDVSGRRAQLETPLRQFVYGKSFDTFGPLGPAVASMEGVDLGNLDVSTTIAGEVAGLARSAKKLWCFGRCRSNGCQFKKRCGAFTFRLLARHEESVRYQAIKSASGIGEDGSGSGVGSEYWQRIATFHQSGQFSGGHRPGGQAHLLGHGDPRVDVFNARRLAQAGIDHVNSKLRGPGMQRAVGGGGVNDYPGVLKIAKFLDKSQVFRHVWAVVTHQGIGVGVQTNAVPTPGNGNGCQEQTGHHHCYRRGNDPARQSISGAVSEGLLFSHSSPIPLSVAATS